MLCKIRFSDAACAIHFREKNFCLSLFLSHTNRKEHAVHPFTLLDIQPYPFNICIIYLNARITMYSYLSKQQMNK